MSPRAQLLWSVRREVWEHRALYWVPVIVALVGLFGFAVGILIKAHPRVTPVQPYGFVAGIIIASTFAVAAIYCLDALIAERRDRSVLFWKSMPVSDFMTVLSKVLIPLAVVPAIAFVVALAAQTTMLVAHTVVLAAKGASVGAPWEAVPIFQMTVVMLYGIVVHTLWYAPIYAWLLLASAWAKRASLLWAVLPFVALMIVESIATRTSYVSSLVAYRFGGAMREAFVGGEGDHVITRVADLDPARFLATPGLWLGLVFAAVFLAGAIRLRRHREPI